jgi:sec-independent protein translocase protein TatA
MLGGLRGPELLIILAVVLLLFGAKKLPDLARSLGASAKEFKKGIEAGADEDEVSESESEEDTPV